MKKPFGGELAGAGKQDKEGGCVKRLGDQGPKGGVKFGITENEGAKASSTCLLLTWGVLQKQSNASTFCVCSS